MKKLVEIFVDDCKPVEWYGAENARVFKTVQECYDYCKKLKRIDILFLDNDTGLNQMTGDYMLEYLVERHGVEIRKVVIISLNAAAIVRMKAFCKFKGILCLQKFAPDSAIIDGQSG